jgi:hypothetical protein
MAALTVDLAGQLADAGSWMTVGTQVRGVIADFMDYAIDSPILFPPAEDENGNFRTSFTAMVSARWVDHTGDLNFSLINGDIVTFIAYNGR